MLVGLSGPTAYYEPGAAYECDEAEAARLIGARYAVPWTDGGLKAGPVEVAVDAPAIETRPLYDFTKARQPGQPAPRVKGKARK